MRIPDLQWYLRRKIKKDVQQEHELSKTDKNLATLSEQVWAVTQPAEKTSTLNRETRLPPPIPWTWTKSSDMPKTIFVYIWILNRCRRE
jgi:hypothetical protein